MGSGVGADRLRNEYVRGAEGIGQGTVKTGEGSGWGRDGCEIVA